MELFIIPIFVLVFWMVAIRPQQRQQREHAAFLRALGPGDEVVTSSGLYGTVSEIDGDIVWLEVALDLELKLDRSAIARAARPRADEEPADEPDNEPADEPATDETNAAPRPARGRPRKGK